MEANYTRNVTTSTNPTFVNSSDIWVERPPQAVPELFLRAKMNYKSQERVTRPRSPKE